MESLGFRLPRLAAGNGFGCPIWEAAVTTLEDIERVRANMRRELEPETERNHAPKVLAGLTVLVAFFAFWGRSL
ncbi:MAG: hypothetical protein DMG70_30395 [Acidobacteria bacterium]|nr:MAG: hypothetical protein DMG70_30395 [Acidobacteriota bacterium]PYY06445.1 MAG: hypothetical protein DMG69_23480 [Acidobacteriota bacterium]